MPGRGRPKKCSKKLNFLKKDENLANDNICNEENILLPVSENNDIHDDVLDTSTTSVVIATTSPILPSLELSGRTGLVEQAPSTSGSIMNYDNMPMYETNNLTEKEPVPLRNNMRVSENGCFFNSVVQVLFSLIPFRSLIYHFCRQVQKIFSMSPDGLIGKVK